jgi:hypothetical protein
MMSEYMEMWMKLMRTWKEIYEKKLQVIMRDHREEIRNCPGLDSVLKRIV